MTRTMPLSEALEAAARGPGGFIHRYEGGRERFRSYADVLSDALVVAGAFDARGLRRGARVALVLADPDDFLTAFLGAVVGGYVPIPTYPPLGLRRLDVYLETARHIVRASGAMAIVTDAAVRRVLGTLRSECPKLEQLITRAELVGPPREEIARPARDEPLFIQFTSGSTSAPKGVVLTHGNLEANVCALGGPSGIAASSEDVGVSWLPLFHDMGLIGMALGSIYHQVTTVIMPPLLFLRRPVEWLRAISLHRGTISFAPNFAYSFCARRVKDAELEGLDLSSWRVAGCGAEPIDARVLDAFATRFAGVGFRRTALLPCYGIAEHTLAVTFPPPGRPLRVDRVRSSALAFEGAAAPAAPDEQGVLAFVGCGRPFPEHRVRIVDRDEGLLPERRVGEIVLSGPSVMAGYEGDGRLTREALRGGWLHTGDLGYVADGELFVCGRRKDVIIINGRNYFPQDVEWAVGELSGVRRGGVVAFGAVDARGRERVVVVVETAEVDRQHDGDIARVIRRHVGERTGVPVHDVVVAPAGTIPKTSSGKVQRSRTRMAYEAGTLLRAPGGAIVGLRHLVLSEWGHVKSAVRDRIAAARRARVAR